MKKEVKFYEDPQAIGTTEWHLYNPIFRNVVITDGVLNMANKLECFWALDIIGSYIPKLQKKGEGFGVAKFVVGEDDSAEFTLDDGNDNIIAKQHIEFTDLKENIKVYVSKDEKYWVILLPSEY